MRWSVQTGEYVIGILENVNAFQDLEDRLVAGCFALIIALVMEPV